MAVRDARPSLQATRKGASNEGHSVDDRGGMGKSKQF
jgi:hypothetical protein